MRWVVERLAAAAILLLLAVLACFAQSVNSIPSPFNPIPRTTTFFTDVVAWMTNEIYQENNEWMNPFVVHGCSGVPVPGLTHVPDACTAYTRGYRVTDVSSITYPDTSTCYVVVDPATAGNVTGFGSAIFQRVGTSHYVINCDGTGAAGIANEPLVMTVTTAGGAITNVVDDRPVSPVRRAILDPSPQTTAWTGPDISVTDGETAMHTTTTAVFATQMSKVIFAFVTLNTVIAAPPGPSVNQCIINVKIDGALVNASSLSNVSTATSYGQVATVVGAATVTAGAHTVAVTLTAIGNFNATCTGTFGRTAILII